MNIKHVCIFFVLILSCSICILKANTVIVDINGTGNYTSIQEGIDNSINGDTVLVYPGTYYENINYNGKNITVTSLYIQTQADSFIHKTVIDGNQNGSVVTFESGEDTTAVLCGFTIQNGSGTYNLHNIRGGGIFCIYSNPKLVNCKIQDNNAEFGGGIHCRYSILCIAGTTICHNHAIYEGGGIYLRDNSNVIFDSINRSNIYFNYAGCGCDIGAYEINGIEIIVDTFTVIEPDDYNTHPYESYDFDIYSNKIEMINCDLYVSPLGNNTSSGLSPDDPSKTISYAMTKIKSDSISCNTIYLANGVYSPTTNEDIFPINCKDYISIQGEEKDQTILDGNNEYFLLYSYEDSDFSIKDITLQNGFNDIAGGGFSINYAYNILLENVNLYCNTANKGGGLYIFKSQGVFENLMIRNNSSDGGGGVRISNNSDPAFINCIIDGNYTITPDWGFGGAINNNVESNSVFINTQITNNISDNCSGITVSGNAGSYCDPTFINCTICDNSENPSGTIKQGDHSHVSLINTILRNPSQEEIIFWEGYPEKTVSLSYCNIDGGINAINTNNSGTIIWGEGNIDEDPLFVGGDPFSYELTKYSPCIDAGTPDTTGLHLPATDLAGNPRIFNGRIDIGAYECQDTISIDQPDTSFIHNLYLFQNTPNPFTNETEILFITADYTRVEEYTLSIYNTKGQLVRRFDGTTNNFWVKTKIVWDGTDEQGRQVAPGTYLYKLEYNGHAVVRKMVLFR